MLEQPMMEKPLAMRLHGMLNALKTQEQDPATRDLAFLERLALLVDQQWNWRQNPALARRLTAAKLAAMRASKRSTTARREDWTKV